MAAYFVCSAAEPDMTFEVEEHPRPSRRSKAPRYGPENPCGKTCKECSLKLELIWPDGQSMRVLVGPHTTCQAILNWSCGVLRRGNGTLCLGIDGAVWPDVNSVASSWGLKSGVSRLVLVAMDDLPPADMANLQPAAEAPFAPAFGPIQPLVPAAA